MNNKNIDHEQEKAKKFTSFLSLSQEDKIKGSITTLYQEPKDDTKNLFFLIVYFYIISVGNLITNIISGLIIIKTYSSQNFDFQYYFLFIIISQFFFIIINIYFYFKYGDRLKDLKPTLCFQTILHLGYFSTYLGIYLYFINIIIAKNIIIFVSFHIIFSSFRFIVGGSMKLTFLPTPSYHFFEALQYLYIVFKYVKEDLEPNWTFIFFFFYVIAAILFLAAINLCILLFACVISMIFIPNIFRGIIVPLKITYFILAFCVIWNSFIFYFFVAGFHNLLINRAIVPGGDKEINHDDLLLKAYYAYMILSFITILIIGIASLKIKDFLKEFTKPRLNTISMVSFVSNLKVNMDLISGNFFGKTNEECEDKEFENEKKNNVQLEECIVCCENLSDILIKSCNHSGICQSCITEHLKYNKKCPFCREKMEKIFIVFFDEERKEYLAKGVIKF